MAELVLGGTGRLGASLLRRRPARAPTRAELDVARADESALARWVRGASVVLNAAALADVDGCELRRDEAVAVNATFPGRLAAVCARLGVPLLHVSTDYVFGGGAGPWAEDAAPCPVQFYGETKARGEALALAHGATVVRVSWLFGPGASPFADHVLRQAAAGGPVAVFVGQRSRPTPLEGLAPWLLAVADHRAAGGPTPPILHAAGGPAAGREDWARAILDAGGFAGMEVVAQGPGALPARRPDDSRLDATRTTAWSRSVGLPPLPDWRLAVSGAGR